MTSNKGFVPTLVIVLYNSQFLACFYKILTEVWCYLNIICLFFQNTEISDNRYFTSSK